MAGLRCSRCGARIQVDGTSTCSCAPIAAGDVVPATFEPFRPRPEDAPSGHTVDATDPKRGGLRHGTGRPRDKRRGRSLAVGVAAAMTLGAVGFALDSMGSGHEAGGGGGRPAVSVSPDPDVVARKVTEKANKTQPDEDPGTVRPSQSGDHGMWPMGKGHGKHPGPAPRPSAPHGGGPAPSQPGDEAAGGASQGGGTGNGGTADGGSSDGGSTGAPGGDDGGSSDGGGGDDNGSGGLLGGLFGALFGGGDDDQHQDDGHSDGNGHGNGHGHFPGHAPGGGHGHVGHGKGPGGVHGHH
ncbi:hypothetical protein HCC61_03945 [Streptomyces sp. HNM0575]|uniref:hypothetical protein n=1 Tax=Streptomyces sp. HNM0575 TaxID=2716338 RepID=UPI00145F4C51|nr:hypothetical protein [Streptomyces sp. HNM0575]NLU71844.1 hypothetical protein [Streptomyces sp. HNM0575]